MDLDALARVFARNRPDLEQLPPEPPERPRESPLSLPPGNPTAGRPDWQEARDERAAIMELDGGLMRECAETAAARLHPDPGPADPAATWHGFTLVELQTAAGEDWPDIMDRPEALQAFALLRRTRAQRDRGERPEHYTRPALCAACGPVWLWEPGSPRVVACPWCLCPPPAGVKIPRPPVRCGACSHFVPSTTSPEAGLGRCRIEAPASLKPPALWPQVRRPCGAWREAPASSAPAEG
jgi:hypothetical protein